MTQFTLNSGLYRRILLGLALAFAVFVGLLLYGDIQEMQTLVVNFQWGWIPAILILTLINYILRGVRFHYYLRLIGLRNISFWHSLIVFIGGFSLTLTPGKVGELIRVFWLKRLADADPARTAPATIADRLVDGLAMATLASLGALVYPQYRVAVIIILGLLVVGIVVFQIRPLMLRLLGWGEKLPVISRFSESIHTLYDSAYTLLRWKPLLVGVGIGVVSWSAEGIAFYLVLHGLGITGGLDLAGLAIFILGLGSILGGASSLPGGLGVAEASMTGMLQVLLGLSDNVAVTATLLIRFFTLWFGVGLGVVVMLMWRKLLFGEATIEEALVEQTLESTPHDR